MLAVTVVHVGAAQEPRQASELQQRWARWDPGVPLRVLRTEYASIAGPIVAFVDRLRKQRDERIIVLIPVILPDRLRYRFLHNHLDTVLTRALRDRPDVIVARVPMRVRVTDRAAPVRVASTGFRVPEKKDQPGRTSRPEDAQAPPGPRR